MRAIDHLGFGHRGARTDADTTVEAICTNRRTVWHGGEEEEGREGGKRRRVASEREGRKVFG